MAYTPPASNAVDFTLIGGYTPPGSNAVDFTLIGGYTPPGSVTGLQDMRLDIAAGADACADTVLDLSAYYQALNDAQIDISVHALVLANLVLDVNLTDGIILIDKILDIAAYYQVLEGAKLDIEIWGDNTQDARFDGILAAWARKDSKLVLSTCVQTLEPLSLSIRAAREISNINAMLDIYFSDGDSLHDAALNLEITDGVTLHDAVLNLAVVEVAPTFKAVYAMHLDSVITEI